MKSQEHNDFMMSDNEKRLNYFKLSAKKPLRMDVIIGILAMLVTITAVALITCLPLSIKDTETGEKAAQFLDKLKEMVKVSRSNNSNEKSDDLCNEYYLLPQ